MIAFPFTDPIADAVRAIVSKHRCARRLRKNAELVLCRRRSDRPDEYPSDSETDGEERQCGKEGANDQVLTYGKESRSGLVVPVACQQGHAAASGLTLVIASPCTGVTAMALPRDCETRNVSGLNR
jgi:hypothetical protein